MCNIYIYACNINHHALIFSTPKQLDNVSGNINTFSSILSFLLSK